MRRGLAIRDRHLVAMLAILALVVSGCSSEPPAPSESSAAGAAPIGSSTPAERPSGSTGPVDAGTVTLTKAGCELAQTVDVVPAGPITITVVNEMDVLGWLNVGRLDEGSTFEDLEAHVAEEVVLAKAGQPGLGHPSYAIPVSDVLVDPNGTGTLEATLSPGAHAILVCGRFYRQVQELRPSGALPLEVSGS